MKMKDKDFLLAYQEQRHHGYGPVRLKTRLRDEVEVDEVEQSKLDTLERYDRILDGAQGNWERHVFEIGNPRF